MRILLLTEFFPETERIEITGGVEARCFFVSRYLKKLGHQVKVISRSRSVNSWQNASYGSVPGRLKFWLEVIMRGVREDFDLIEGTNYTTYLPAWILGTIKRKPIVFWYPDVFVGFWVKNVGLAGFLFEIIERLELKLPVRLYLAISDSTGKKLAAKGIEKDKIKVVPCGVDREEVKKIKVSSPKYSLCFVGRLVSYKRVEVLIKSVGILKKDFPKVSLLIIGQGPEKKGLEKLAGEYKIRENVVFLGHIPFYCQVLENMATAKIFCLPSQAEGFGIALIEAAALGRPFVASDIPALREITENGKGGFLFKTGDEQELAAKIGILLTNDQVYKSKSKEALELAAKYDWEKVAKETEKIYESLHFN